MKNLHALIGVGLISLLAGCSTTPVALAPVGPNPLGGVSTPALGELQVYSRMAVRSEGDNPVWRQHTGYYVYDLHGRLVKHVYNTVGHYASAPRPVALSAGKYLVKAEARDYFWVEVPVTIERGRMTNVHLDDNWSLPADAPSADVVCLPNGRPVGWRVATTQRAGIN